MDEQILAFVSRMTGSARDHVTRNDNRLDGIVRSITFGFPGLLNRMNQGGRFLRRKGILVPHGALDVNQPEIHLALCRISAKFALAEYYERTTSIALPDTRIKTMWTHYFDENSRDIASLILKEFPTCRSLVSGKQNMDSEFFMRTGDLDGHQFTVSFFYESVMLAAQLVIGEMPPNGGNWMKVFSPSAAEGMAEVGGI